MFFRTVWKFGQIFLPFCHNTRVWQTDGQTDGRTDGQTDRILIAIPRLHYMQRGKNTVQICTTLYVIIKSSKSHRHAYIQDFVKWKKLLVSTAGSLRIANPVLHNSTCTAVRWHVNRHRKGIDKVISGIQLVCGCQCAWVKMKMSAICLSL